VEPAVCVWPLSRSSEGMQVMGGEATLPSGEVALRVGRHPALVEYMARAGLEAHKRLHEPFVDATA
jgi:hypothetical protein